MGGEGGGWEGGPHITCVSKRKCVWHAIGVHIEQVSEYCHTIFVSLWISHTFVSTVLMGL